uniref:Uncharacterized protein n=1 Tax=Setaria digitata TaxID=48799 RepID=A0A915Q667_9BILA
MEIMLVEMNGFVMRLEPRMRDRFNGSLQKALIESLLDGTVFAIVESLSDLQRMNETVVYSIMTLAAQQCAVVSAQYIMFECRLLGYAAEGFPPDDGARPDKHSSCFLAILRTAVGI